MAGSLSGMTNMTILKHEETPPVRSGVKNIED
jgi:hypothetical protein